MATLPWTEEETLNRVTDIKLERNQMKLIGKIWKNRRVFKSQTHYIHVWILNKIALKEKEQFKEKQDNKKNNTSEMKILRVCECNSLVSFV